MESLFKVDGQTFSGVGVESLQRSARISDGPAADYMDSGDYQRDITGTYYDYTLIISAADMLTNEYDAMYEILTSPVDSHTVEMPYGASVLTFEAMIESVDDELIPMDAGTWWGNMILTFKAKSPQRVPE